MIVDMSQTDKIFKKMCREILFNGTNDYDQKVRPPIQRKYSVLLIGMTLLRNFRF